jgi:hypothetical protein
MGRTKQKCQRPFKTFSIVEVGRAVSSFQSGDGAVGTTATRANGLLHHRNGDDMKYESGIMF